MKHVISASRRTDLPGCHYDWLQQVLQSGEVVLENPVFREKSYRVDLRPECVHTLVLWSKDFSNVLARPMYLDNYNLYFQYTINNYSKRLEPNVPAYKHTLAVLEGLLSRYRPEQFNIRFDPVILSIGGEMLPTPAKTGQARLKVFETLCRDLAGLGMSGCRITTSYIALYDHVKRRLANHNIDITELTDKIQVLFFKKIVEIAARYGFMLYSCSSPLLEAVEGIHHGKCIDGWLLEELFGGKVSKAKDGGQRASCGCTKSSDIGSYRQLCAFSCAYCYSGKHVR
jgi:hypothetical protein